MITDWTSMHPAGSNEYWPELQQAIDDWEQRIHDGHSTSNMLVWALLQAEQRAEAAEQALALVDEYAAYYAEVTAQGDAPETFANWRNGANDAGNPYVQAQQEVQA